MCGHRSSPCSGSRGSRRRRSPGDTGKLKVVPPPAPEPPPPEEWGWMWWVGVPLAIRLYAERLPGANRAGSMPGCGCTVAGLGLLDRWDEAGGACLVLAELVERAAVPASHVLAALVGIRVALFPLSRSSNLYRLIRSCMRPAQPSDIRVIRMEGVPEGDRAELSAAVRLAVAKGEDVGEAVRRLTERQIVRARQTAAGGLRSRPSAEKAAAAGPRDGVRPSGGPLGLGVGE